MKKPLLTAAVCLVALAAPASAADFIMFRLDTNVSAPVDKVWSKVGGFCGVADWLGVGCQLTLGSGDIGTIRHLTGAPNGTIDEIMVARAPHSYGYMVMGSPVLLHGMLAAEPIDAAHTRLTYTVLYDQSSLATPADKAAARDRRTQIFSGALAKMKEIAEKP